MSSEPGILFTDPDSPEAHACRREIALLVDALRQERTPAEVAIVAEAIDGRMDDYFGPRRTDG